MTYAREDGYAILIDLETSIEKCSTRILSYGDSTMYKNQKFGPLNNMTVNS